MSNLRIVTKYLGAGGGEGYKSLLMVFAREKAARSPGGKFKCKVISHPKVPLRACS